MNAYSYAWLGFSVLCGFVAWRGSRHLWRSVFAGIAAPIIGLITLGALLGRGNLESLSPLGVLIGTALVLVFLIIAWNRLFEGVR